MSRVSITRGGAALSPYICGVSLSLLATLLPAQSRILEIDGESSSQFGVYAFAVIGDIDRDGAPDFATDLHGTDTPNGPGTGRISVHSGADGRVLYRIDGTPTRGTMAIAGVGDVDGDGYPDLASGNPQDNSVVYGGGSVTVYSGRTGKEVRYWRIAHRYAFMGYDVAPAGDLDRDGHADVLVGFLYGSLFNPPSMPTMTGEARVLSGKDGSVIHQILDINGFNFGSTTEPAGDIDRDGYPDFYVGDGRSRLEAYSGKTGKRIASYQSPFRVGGSFAADLGDVDKDGVPDLGWGGSSSSAGVNSGVFMVFSNGSGKLLYTYWGAPSDYMGAPLALGDVDGDGHADFAAGAGQAHSASVLPGYVQAWSGRTGKTLFWVTGTTPNENFGRALALLGDVTGDGAPEFLVASQGPFSSSGTWGRTTMFSTVDLGLTATPHRLSVQQAGTQSFALDVGTRFASQNYWLVGSMSGTRPGTPLGGFTVPLNADAYTALTLGSFNNIYLWQFRSQLDAAGRARPELRLPALPPTMGLTLHHAALVYRGDGTVLQVTNPVSLRLEN